MKRFSDLINAVYFVTFMSDACQNGKHDTDGECFERMMIVSKKFDHRKFRHKRFKDLVLITQFVALTALKRENGDYSIDEKCFRILQRTARKFHRRKCRRGDRDKKHRSEKSTFYSAFSASRKVVGR